MKKIISLFLVAVLAFGMVSCAFPAMPGVTTAPTPGATTTTEPATPLTVTSCTEVSYVNGVHTYRLTFSDGATADFSVKDGVDGAPGEPGEAGAPGAAGAASAPGAPGEPGASLTVKSCVSLGTVDGVTTWRLTFSDDTTADFTVTNGTTPEGVDWNDLILRLDAMNELLNAEKPDMKVGHSTVTNSALTTSGSYTPSTVTGRGFPLKKSVMFGADDTVHVIRLNRCDVYKKDDSTLVTSGKVTIEVQTRAYDSTYLASNTTHVKTYVTTVEMKPNMTYIDLPITISRSDLETIGDDDYFYMNIGVLSEEGDKAIVLSSNSSFHFVSDERENGTEGPRLYAGYTTNGIAEKTPGNSHSYHTPDIFFCTGTKKAALDFSGLAGNVTGGNGDGDSSDEEKKEVYSLDNLLQLPDQYDLVVGDTFELFYKGIACCVNSEAFDYKLSFSDGKNRGHNYSRKYVWTPEEKDVGVHTLTISARDNLGKIVDTETVKLNVVNKPKSPTEERVYLFVGASDCANGTWPREVVRRLTGTTTTVSSGVTGPKGDGLTNIKTIGTNKSTESNPDVFYEGYGGWSFTSYTTAYTARPYFVYILGNFASLELSQHSFYKDGNGALWKLESIEESRIKLIAVKEVGGNVDTSRKVIPASGELTKVSSAGANDAGKIKYNSTAAAEGNPFWSAEKNRNDFKAYAEKHGVEKIDEIVVNLVWNSSTSTPEQYIQNARAFVDGVLADFPDCHISIVTGRIPARDGMGANYGITWPYFEKIENTAFAFQRALIDLSNEEQYGDQVSIISMGALVDTDNVFPTSNLPINNRVPEKVPVHNNALHPNVEGHYQFADAIYRHLATRLQGK